MTYAVHQIASALHPVQLRMARVALGLTTRQAADVTGVSRNTISRIEAGEVLKPSTIQKVRAALEAAGLEFIPENGGGAGIRFRERREVG
ncbi:helix-turn-helix transcriptional regulator [Methylobacterium sp. E-065]|uniref:helix-turn-helix transcriptional regulator n=1 Tax=Methylobacterium sp. E-065 TaxID=2836583 RepID=UPI0028BF083C|nr:helix-turn-helix transcriptional regulator [Methylobacterium sp. E-065]